MTARKRPEFEDIPVDVEYAVAVLRWGAAEEEAPGGAHKAAVREIRDLTAGPDGRIAFGDVLAAINKYVPEPGKFIHGRTRDPDSPMIIGTYWALEDAIRTAREPGAECAWTDGLYFHDLRITAAADGTTAWFHAFCPERFAVSNPDRRERIIAEIAEHAGPKITLSMPRTTPGEAQIRARGKGFDVIVGECVRSGNQWRATLWSRPGQHTPGDPFIYGPSLKQIRDEQLQPQLNREGPWWQ